MVRYFLTLLFLVCTVFSPAQLIVNELQSSNIQTIQDEFYEYPDWIEIYNKSGDTVSLSGWHITDERDEPLKWAFPDYELKPNQYLILYASGRDISTPPVLWSTVIDRGAEYRYMVPTVDQGDTWKDNGFNDSSWSLGTSGFGYSDDDDNTIVTNGVASVYVRKEFEIADLSKISQIILHVDYDDGFVAYINGVEVARANLGAAGEAVTWDQYTAVDHEAQMYAGGQPDRFDVSEFINLLQEGTNTLAIEVHNISASSSDMSLIPFLTLGKTSYDEPTESASNELFLGNSSMHTNFKLKSDGEIIILSNASNTVVDSLVPVMVPPGYSFGKLFGVDQYSYFMDPTPGYQNGSDAYALLDFDTIIFSKNGGYFNGAQNITLSAGVGDTIYYTMDGTDPSISSNLYENQIAIGSNAALRARIIRSGYLPGKIHSRTFFSGHDSDIPVLCITTDPDNLWDYYTGIYELGPNAEVADPHFGANYWMDWEKPANVEYYDEQGNIVLNQISGIKIFGAWSRARPQKSFAVFARKNYGSPSFDTKLFKKSDITEYKSFVLRNAGNDWDLAFFRDGFMTDITSHLDLDHQAFKPVATYLNGEYWGIYNMREKINEDFLEGHHGFNANDYNILQNDGEIIEGDNTEYLSLKTYLENNTSLASATNYSYVSDKVDIINFIKYQLVQVYINNRDWPGNNNKYWNTIHPGSKFHWILYDTDFGFGLYDSDSYNENTLSFALEEFGPGWPNPPWSTLLFRRLVTNTGFRHQFINYMADNINTTFLPSNINTCVDSIKAMYINEMPYHKVRWSQNYDDWEVQVDRIKNWGKMRPNYMQDFILSQFNLSSTARITLAVSDKQHGYIRLNSISPKEYPFGGTYFKDVPVEIEAIPLPGYKFSHWEGANQTSDRVISHNPESNATFKAVFEKASAQDVKIVINEINYNSGIDFASADWIELYNSGASTVDLSGFKLTDANPDSGFILPEGKILAPGEFIVIVKNSDKFSNTYPDVSNYVGEFAFGLSSSGDQIRLYDSVGRIVDAVDYLPFLPWPEDANGLGPTLELTDASMDNGQPEYWIAIANGGTPGKTNTGIVAITETFPVFVDDISVFPTRFSDYTTIEYRIDQNSDVKVEVIDIQGRLISTIFTGYQTAGLYSYNWQPDGFVQGGIYVVRLSTDNTIENERIIYTK